MNGRLYDPKLHTFLMPDNFVQQPENTQSYNRYAYCINNPLKYTDPSGELFGLDDLAAAIIIGAFIGGATYYVTCLTTGQNFSFGGLAQATFIGAASAAVTFGIGSGASSMFTQTATSFWQGAVQGAIVGSITGAGGAIVNGLFNGGNITLKEVLGGALIGGAIGAVAGGIKGGINAKSNDSNFWTGKSNWQEVKIGGGIPRTASGTVNFKDQSWNVDKKLEVPQVFQEGEFDCTHACKLSSDKFFNSTGQAINNQNWLNKAVQNSGIFNTDLQGMYNASNYSTLSLGNGTYQIYNPRITLPWMVKQMNLNRLVQIGWTPQIGGIGHASLINNLRYLNDFSKFEMYLMNPQSGGTQMLTDFSKIYQVFSLWK